MQLQNLAGMMAGAALGAGARYLLSAQLCLWATRGLA